MAKCVHRAAHAALLAGVVFLARPDLLLASPIIDPAGDLRTFDPANPNSYAGPQNPALDVLSAEVILDSVTQTLTFTSTMGGPLSSLVGPGNANLGIFAWGINHGYGNNNFASIGLAGVVFDAVLSVNANGTGTYRGTATPAGSITTNGNTITAILPIAFLGPPPAPGNATGPLLPIELWSFNLWPRSAIRFDGTPLGGGNQQIADFAPDNAMFRATPVPEPATMLLLASGLVAARITRRRRA